MKTKALPLLALALVWALLALAPAGRAAAPKQPAGYDPQRDPAADLQQAIAAARSGGQRILLEVGGEWCGWCHLLNGLVTEDAEVAKRLHESFLVVKVNWSPENENRAFLSRYPAIDSYPHVYVLDTDGRLLHPDDLHSIEAKQGYDREKLLAFLTQWAQKQPSQPEEKTMTPASGTFDVKLNPQGPDEITQGTPVGRMAIDKQFHGDLEATSKGQMLMTSTEVQGSAGYVALEQVSGTLRGRKGTFVLQHNATMNRGVPQLSILVVPDSGTGELAGLTGRMDIQIADGKHSYSFAYSLPEKP